MLKQTLAGVALLVAASLTHAADSSADSKSRVGAGVPAFDVRPGYKVTLVADGLDAARFLQVGDDGTLYLSQPQQGTIIALTDKDGDGVYETKTPFLTGYPDAHSMTFHDGWLYVTSAADGSCKRAKPSPGGGKAETVETFLPPGSVPAGGGHPFRGIVFGKDALYISVSDPQNMTEDLNSDRKTVYKFDLNGKNRSVFATGVRNTEKLQLRPGTDEVWGVDHGSDEFGKLYGEGRRNKPITDELPGEELNYFTQGSFYGHPYLSNNRIVRPEFAGRKDIIDLAAKTVAPEWIFGAHWAGNGFTFLAKDYFADHKGDMVVAFHGSWNSSVRVGYRVERVLFDTVTGKPYGSQRLVSTLSSDGKNDVLGRPVDCAEAPNGTILFSCDQTKKIYRISKAD